MHRIFVGIPVLNRLDLLRECLDAIDLPAEVVIVNNNSVDPEFTAALSRVAGERGIDVLHQRRNLGVSASWNLLIRTALARGHRRVFIGSNDTRLHRGSLGAAWETPEEVDVALWLLHDFNFFLLSRGTIERVGWFDENFYPAYKEDQDYVYRCRLAGLRVVQVPGAGADHAGSATIRSNPDYARQCDETHFNWNLSHYLCKWGGDFGGERFTRPYDDPARDLRWWPDPGETIPLRDWDNIYRPPSLRQLYDRAALSPSDIFEHVPTLYKYGSSARHVTEFGTGFGNSACAFLFARPDRFISYDITRVDQIASLEAAAAQAGVDARFVIADTRDLEDIEPTDLLFIDTRHTFEQVSAELRFAHRVRRYIVLHDTETFGLDGEPGGGQSAPRGIWPAVSEFLRGHDEWEIHRVDYNNNGLTVLRRAGRGR